MHDWFMKGNQVLISRENFTIKGLHLTIIMMQLNTN